jgi:outer membrane protein TolC
VANLDVAQARLTVQRARVGVLRTASRYLPNVGVGGLYTMHDGSIQNTAGNISIVNRDSLFTGLSSSLSFSISDAIFALPEANRILMAARFGLVRVQNDTLLRVAEAYFAALRARRQLARLDETLDFLTSEEESELRGRSKGLLPLISAFVKAGSALPSDEARVEADVVRRSAERIAALEGVRVAGAELSRLLHLDASLMLLPVDDFRWPIPVPGMAWHGKPLEDLVPEALRGRPELAENAALLEAAVARYRAAKWRPLLPVVIANVGYGAFGGGPSIVGRTATGGNLFGNSGVIDQFSPRLDIDLGLQWRLDGLGLGTAAAIRDGKIAVDQLRIQQMQIQDLVVAQVVQSVEQIRRGRQRVQVCRAGLFDDRDQPTGAIYRSLRLNFVRIKGGQGLPLEVLDSTRRLSDVLAAYADALTDYDRARFRLLIALGQTQAALELPDLVPPR